MVRILLVVSEGNTNQTIYTEMGGERLIRCSAFRPVRIQVPLPSCLPASAFLCVGFVLGWSPSVVSQGTQQCWLIIFL